MATSWMMGNKLKGYNVLICRKNETGIYVSTEKRLTDDQVQELAWLVSAMVESGKTLSELFDQNGNDHRGDIIQMLNNTQSKPVDQDAIWKKLMPKN